VRPKDHIAELGKRLYVKITEVIRHEIEEITIDDCIRYMHEMVIARTFQGYCTEITNVYGRLQAELGLTIRQAPDDWDRLSMLIFTLRSTTSSSESRSSLSMTQHKYHKSTRNEACRKRAIPNSQRNTAAGVLRVFSKGGRERTIANPEVIEEMQCEIERLKSLS